MIKERERERERVRKENIKACKDEKQADLVNGFPTQGRHYMSILWFICRKNKKRRIYISIRLSLRMKDLKIKKNKHIRVDTSTRYTARVSKKEN